MVDQRKSLRTTALCRSVQEGEISEAIICPQPTTRRFTPAGFSCGALRDRSRLSVLV
jgi:hypothetical protein